MQSGSFSLTELSQETQLYILAIKLSCSYILFMLNMSMIGALELLLLTK